MDTASPVQPEDDRPACWRSVRRFGIVLMLLFAVIFAVAWWLMTIEPDAILNRANFERIEPDAIVNRANFERIEKGMTIEQIEAILGERGGNYSSDTEVDYFIWKGRSGWIYVTLKQNRVTRMRFNPKAGF